MESKPLKVGFDLDGVILYNPARIIRPVVSGVKRFFLKKRGLKFYFPKSKPERFIWDILHKSSFLVAPGFDEIKEIAQNKKIDAYIISARYSFLDHDFKNWMKKIDSGKVFKDHLHNLSNLQPHLFKEAMIKKFAIDVFIEDNWDIANYLHQRLGKKTKIVWIYNLFDKNIHYPNKVPSLKKFADLLKKDFFR